MKKILIVFVVSSVCLVKSFAAGTNSASFLKIRTSARSAAMAGAICAVGSGASALEGNPAGLINTADKTSSAKNEVIFNHNEWFEGIRSEYVGYARQLNDEKEKRAIGLSSYYLYMGDTVRRKENGDPDGTYGASNGMFAASYAQSINSVNKDILVGASAKYISESIDSKSGAAYACDMGMIYKRDSRTNLGISIKNLGSSMKMYTESFNLPLTLALGGGYLVKDNLLVATDLEQELGNSVIARFGGEYAINYGVDGDVKLRGGYIYTAAKRADIGITMGFGVNLRNMCLDYAFVPFGDLGSTHRISFGIKY
jgi:hypothetical protein